MKRPRAARGALPLRRRAPGVRDARGRHPPPARAAGRGATSPATPAARRPSPAASSPRRPVAAIAAAGVKQMAQRFIVGADAKDSLPTITKLWKNGVDATVDLLGEATVSEAEADRYMQRCEDALRALAAGRHASTRPRRQPLRQGLRAHPAAASRGAGARDRGRATAPAPPAARRPRRRRAPARRHGVLRHARGDHRAHARPALRARVRRRPVRRHRPAGLPRPSRRSTSRSCSTGPREHPRTHPFTIRLVKGAYWDHEVVQAAQHGWAPPVFTDRRACDRNFELLTKRLIDATPTGPRRDRLAQPALDLPRRRLRGRARRRQRATSSSRSCAGWATTRRPRSPPPAAACAPTARSATSSPAWPTSCAACSRTPPTTPSSPPHASGTNTAELLEAP